MYLNTIYATTLLLALSSLSALASDTPYHKIMVKTKWRANALILEYLQGNTECGTAHIDFLNALDDPKRIIDSSTSQKILFTYGLCDANGYIRKEIYAACIWYRAQGAEYYAHKDTMPLAPTKRSPKKRSFPKPPSFS